MIVTALNALLVVGVLGVFSLLPFALCEANWEVCNGINRALTESQQLAFYGMVDPIVEGYRWLLGITNCTWIFAMWWLDLRSGLFASRSQPSARADTL